MRGIDKRELTYLGVAPVRRNPRTGNLQFKRSQLRYAPEFGDTGFGDAGERIYRDDDGRTFIEDTRPRRRTRKVRRHE